MDKRYFSKSVDLKNIEIDDPFWNGFFELVRKEVIPYQHEALHDRIDGAEKSYCIENFKKAARADGSVKYPVDKWFYDDGNCDENAFHGWVFQDSDAYKWLEAAAYSLTGRPDPELESKADGVIDLIASAQLENGYLDTLYIINDREKIFTNLRDFHELYCFGHLAEAGVAYYKATGKDKLLGCALRFADLICSVFGDKEGQKRGYGGHEIAELALVKLYETTGERRYLETAEFFINERGKKPYYYDLEHGVKTEGLGYFYNQAHVEPREQREAVGHAVRGVYLYSGMADVSKHCNDDGLYQACRDIWNDIENKKLYITGGIGSTVHGEAFSFAYDLPNDLAYCETCASIGLMFFAKRMEEIYPCSHYGAVAERALYNTVLSGMAEDGKAFFYVNPLEVLPEASAADERKKHVKTVRQKWFGCACCPPNLARLLSSLGGYAFSENGDTVFIHQYLGARVSCENAGLEIVSTYPENGRVKISVYPEKRIRLAVRIPEWSRGSFCDTEYSERDGYAYFEIDKATQIELNFNPDVRIIKCSNLVRENMGRAALTRGPFVYCVESADNGNDLQMLRLDKSSAFTADGEYIIADGFREEADERLYSSYEEARETKVKIKFIPYYRWGNRGENEMQVYIRI